MFAVLAQLIHQLIAFMEDMIYFKRKAIGDIMKIAPILLNALCKRHA